VLSSGIFVGMIHQRDGMLIAAVRVLLRTFGLSDADRIPRFEEFQRQVRVQDHGIELVAGGNIPTPFHEFIFGIHGFGRTLGVVAYYVLKHH